MFLLCFSISVQATEENEDTKERRAIGETEEREQVRIQQMRSETRHPDD